MRIAARTALIGSDLQRASFVVNADARASSSSEAGNKSPAEEMSPLELPCTAQMAVSTDSGPAHRFIHICV